MSRDPSQIVEAWKRRLALLPECPPWAGGSRRHKPFAFIPWSEREVSHCEACEGFKFPALFREYLLQMGKEAADLFIGSDLTSIGEFGEARLEAERILAKFHSPPPSRTTLLPRDAAVFLFHQGYTFCFIQASGGFDGPVFQWLEHEAAPKRASPSFEAFVNAELDLMQRNR